jgi:hypothetical protein
VSRRKPRCWVVRWSKPQGVGTGDYLDPQREQPCVERADAREFASFAEAEAARQGQGRYSSYWCVVRRGVAARAYVVGCSCCRETPRGRIYLADRLGWFERRHRGLEFATRAEAFAARPSPHHPVYRRVPR